MARRKTLPAADSPQMRTLTFGTLTRVVPRAKVQAVLAQHGKASKYACKLPAHFLVYYLMTLSLQMSLSSREVLRWLWQGLTALWGAAQIPAKVAGKSTISMARAALGWAVMRDLFVACVGPLATPATRGAWYHDLRLVAFDGSTFAVEDTPDNAAAFGYPGSRTGTSAHPLVRVVALAELGTHTLVAVTHGAYREGEQDLAVHLLPTLQPGQLCLADRNFFSFALWQAARRTGAHLLWRVKKNAVLPCEAALPDGSYLSAIYASDTDRARRRHGVPVRVIEYRLPHVPTAEPVYRLITTLLDPAEAPAIELAALYPERWEFEGALAEVKTTLRGGADVVLRSRTADGVRQELYGLLLAHHAICGVRHDAALQADEDPDTLSYGHTVAVLRRTLPEGAALPPSAALALV
jgi:hypothetical protein